MPYTDKEKVLLFLNRLKALTVDEELEPLPYLDIDGLIGQATNIVNQSVGQRYKLPLPETLPSELGIIETITTIIAAKFTWESWYAERQKAQTPKPLSEYWKWATATLEKIAKGVKGYELISPDIELKDETPGMAAILNNTTEADLNLSRSAFASDPVLEGDF